MKIVFLLLFCSLMLLPMSGYTDDHGGDGPSAASEEQSEKGVEDKILGVLSEARERIAPTKELLMRHIKSLKDRLTAAVENPSRRKTPRVVIDVPPPLPKPMPEQPVSTESETVPAAPEPPEPVEPEVSMPSEVPEKTTPLPEPMPESTPPPAPEEPDKVSALPQKPEREELSSSKTDSSPVKALSPGKIKPTPPLGELAETEKKKPVPEQAKLSEPEMDGVGETQQNLPSVPTKAGLESLPAPTIPDPPVVVEVVVEPDGSNVSPWAPVIEIRKSIEKEPQGSVLMLGRSLALGLAFDREHEACIEKHHGYVRFCTLDIQWPQIIENIFNTSVTLYQGTQAVTRFDDAKLTHAHALFYSTGLEQVVAYLKARFGPPLESINRIVVPFEGRPNDNPTYIWRRSEVIDDILGDVTLEVRKYDDSRGAFPDMKHGLIRLYGDHSLPIFPRVSPREMMLVKYAVN